MLEIANVPSESHQHRQQIGISQSGEGAEQTQINPTVQKLKLQNRYFIIFYNVYLDVPAPQGAVEAAQQMPEQPIRSDFCARQKQDHAQGGLGSSHSLPVRSERCRRTS